MTGHIQYCVMRAPFGGLRIRTEIVDASLMITQVQYLSDLDKASRPLNELAKDAKDQIETYFGDGHNRNIQIEYIHEENPMGTIGSVAMVQHFEHDYILVTNSDILTNLDYEHFFIDTVKKQADLAVVTIPYQVNVPYAVLETHEGQIQSLKEKPTYTYYSNGGIYLMKKEMLSFIPPNAHFNATDLIESLIYAGKKVSSYPLLGYWLDIGNPDDYQKAQQDLPHIQF